MTYLKGIEESRLVKKQKGEINGLNNRKEMTIPIHITGSL